MIDFTLESLSYDLTTRRGIKYEVYKFSIIRSYDTFSDVYIDYKRHDTGEEGINLIVTIIHNDHVRFKRELRSIKIDKLLE